MNKKDWDFAFGDLGDPVHDVKDWFLRPFAPWVKEMLHKDLTAKRSKGESKK